MGAAWGSSDCFTQVRQACAEAVAVFIFSRDLGYDCFSSFLKWGWITKTQGKCIMQPRNVLQHALSWWVRCLKTVAVSLFLCWRWQQSVLYWNNLNKLVNKIALRRQLLTPGQGALQRCGAQRSEDAGLVSMQLAQLQSPPLLQGKERGILEVCPVRGRISSQCTNPPRVLPWGAASCRGSVQSSSLPLPGFCTL